MILNRAMECMDRESMRNHAGTLLERRDPRICMGLLRMGRWINRGKHDDGQFHTQPYRLRSCGNGRRMRSGIHR